MKQVVCRIAGLCFLLVIGVDCFADKVKDGTKLERTRPGIIQFRGDLPKSDRLDYWVLLHASSQERIAKYSAFTTTFLPSGSYTLRYKLQGGAERPLGKVVIYPGKSHTFQVN